MDIVRQIAEREGRRVGLEESLPSLIIASIVFPVSIGSGKGLVHGTREQGVVVGMLGIRSASLAMCRFVRVKSPMIFARRGMVC